MYNDNHNYYISLDCNRELNNINCYMKLYETDFLTSKGSYESPYYSEKYKKIPKQKEGIRHETF